jgi:phosphoenolpyruvate carboxykinase (GTP)
MVGEVGVVRRDPMAMKPFCGYNFADYWAHWLSFPERSEHLPKIFHVNWFRQNDDGDFLWPGFGENIRVLEWIIDRVEHRADAKETPIGFLPHIEDLNTRNLDISPEFSSTSKAMVTACQKNCAGNKRPSPTRWTKVSRKRHEKR